MFISYSVGERESGWSKRARSGCCWRKCSRIYGKYFISDEISESEQRVYVMGNWQKHYGFFIKMNCAD